MSDKLQKLEEELAAMRPRGVSKDLIQRIEVDIVDGKSWGDRMLIGAMSAGAIAACVIVSMLVMGSDNSSATMSISPSPMMGNFSLVMVHTDAKWIDDLK